MNINLDDLHRLMVDVELALIDLRNKQRALERALRDVQLQERKEMAQRPNVR